MVKEYSLGEMDLVPEGAGKAFDVGGRTIAVFRSRGLFFAMANRCVHKGASMCDGSLTADGNEIRCPWHNWPFDLASGQHRLDARQRARTYPIRVEDGKLILTV